eukprot:jgi/Hompol1/2015/HPOL_001212-RA
MTNSNDDDDHTALLKGNAYRQQQQQQQQQPTEAAADIVNHQARRFSQPPSPQHDEHARLGTGFENDIINSETDNLSRSRSHSGDGDGDGHGDEETEQQPGQRKPPLSILQMLLINGFWFGYQMLWFVVTVVTLPEQVLSIVGPDHKGSGLAIVSLTSGIVFIVLSPICGTLNDRFGSQLGRRVPFVVAGTLGMCAFLFTMWSNESLAAYSVGYNGMCIASIVCSVPFNGLIADITPAQQNGRMSSVMGAVNLSAYLVGSTIGIFVQSLTETQLYLVMSSIFIAFTIPTAIYTREPAHHYIQPSTELATPAVTWKQFIGDMIKPLWTHRNFRLVFISRLLFQLGIATIQQYLQYWIQDCIATDLSPSRAVSIGFIPNMLLAPITALMIPQTHRKIVVYIAAALMIASCLLIMIVKQFEWVLVVSAVFGAGFGPFTSVEFAMLMDVLPDKRDVARDMSLWHMAMILPQLVATPVAGVAVTTMIRGIK